MLSMAALLASLWVFGDSHSESARVKAWPDYIQERTGVVVKNLSTGGVKIIDSDVPRQTWCRNGRDRVVVFLGHNDAMQGVQPWMYKRQYRRMLGDLQALKCKVLLILPPEREETRDIREFIRYSAGVYGYPWIDLKWPEDGLRDGIHADTHLHEQQSYQIQEALGW